MTAPNDAAPDDCPGCGAEADGGWHFDDCLRAHVEVTLFQIVLARRLLVSVEERNRRSRRSLETVRAMHRVLDAELERLAVPS